jgi:hypothetical protein
MVLAAEYSHNFKSVGAFFRKQSNGNIVNLNIITRFLFMALLVIFFELLHFV